MNLKLHIDNITLEGVTLPRSQRPQLQASVEAELSRLFVTQGIPQSLQKSGQIPYVPTNLTITGNPNPTQLGQHVAQSIYTHLQSDRTESVRTK